MAFAGNASFPYYGTEAAELTIRPAVTRRALTDVFAISEGLKGVQYVQFLERIGLITTLDPGCGQGAKGYGSRKTAKKFQPVDLKGWYQECWTNLRGTAEEVQLSAGNAKSDLGNTEYGAAMLQLLSIAIGEDLVRMAYFADKDITAAQLTDSYTAPNGDVYTAAQLVKFFKTFNGLFKNTAIGVAAGQTKTVSIAKNLATSDQILAPEDSFAIFQQLFAKQDPRLRSQPQENKLLLVTSSIMEAWTQYRESRNLDLSYTAQGDGVLRPTYRGVTIIEMPEWDDLIATFFKPSTLNGKVDKPHRAILSLKGNFQLKFDGTPVDSNGGADLEVWRSQDTELWNARQLYAADEQTADDALVVIAQ